MGPASESLDPEHMPVVFVCCLPWRKAWSWAHRLTRASPRPGPFPRTRRRLTKTRTCATYSPRPCASPGHWLASSPRWSPCSPRPLSDLHAIQSRSPLPSPHVPRRPLGGRSAKRLGRKRRRMRTRRRKSCFGPVPLRWGGAGEEDSGLHASPRSCTSVPQTRSRRRSSSFRLRSFFPETCTDLGWWQAAVGVSAMTASLGLSKREKKGAAPTPQDFAQVWTDWTHANWGQQHYEDGTQNTGHLKHEIAGGDKRSKEVNYCVYLSAKCVL